MISLPEQPELDDTPESEQTGPGNEHSEEVPEEGAKKWTRREMEEAQPYPLPEVPDD